MKDDLFSERFGHGEARPPQIQDVSENLRKDLWNVIVSLDFRIFSEYSVWVGGFADEAEFSEQSDFYEFARYYSLATGRIHMDDLEIDAFAPSNAVFHVRNSRVFFRNHLLELPWWGVFDFIEVLISFLRSLDTNPDSKSIEREDGVPKNFAEEINRAFARHNAQYSLIGDVVVPVSQEPERKALEVALGDGCPEFVRKQIAAAAKYARSGSESDNRNAVKESANALEGLLHKITGNSTSGVASQVGQLQRENGLNGLVGEGMIKFYAWSSTVARHTKQEGAAEKDLVGDLEARLALHLASSYTTYLLLRHLQDEE